MAKYVIDEKILKDLADAIRSKDGSTELIYPQAMADKILNLELGSGDLPDTIILVDEEGNEYMAVLIDETNN